MICRLYVAIVCAAIALVANPTANLRAIAQNRPQNAPLVIGTKYALLIGINNYTGTNYRDLPSAGRRDVPLFGFLPALDRPVAVAVAEFSNKVLLDVGSSGGIGPGSEFTSLGDADGAKIVVRVDSSPNTTQSAATIVSPTNFAVRLGTQFELTKWIIAPHDPLLFYADPNGMAIGKIREAAISPANSRCLGNGPSRAGLNLHGKVMLSCSYFSPQCNWSTKRSRVRS